jgi:hypothetical protein
VIHKRDLGARHALDLIRRVREPYGMPKLVGDRTPLFLDRCGLVLKVVDLHRLPVVNTRSAIKRLGCSARPVSVPEILDFDANVCWPHVDVLA